MRQLKIRILENKKIARGFYRMRVESGYLARNTAPGQFFEVRCSSGDEPLLRRPLGAHRILKGGVEMLYEVVGKGTELLSRKSEGGCIDIIGPLGNGFSVQSTGRRLQGTAVLVAGGIGVAPLTALAEKLRQARHKVNVIIGAKTGSHVLCEKEFKALGCSVKVATEDGSKGRKGLATDLLRCTMYDARCTAVYACGPLAMLEAVAGIAESKRLPCQVSLDERMACGVGVCLGCPVKVKTKYDVRNKIYEYKMVCKDGPVFDAKEIAW